MSSAQILETFTGYCCPEVIITMVLYKDDEFPMGYSSWEEVYVDELLFMIYDLGNKKQKLEEELDTLMRMKTTTNGSFDNGGTSIGFNTSVCEKLEIVNEGQDEEVVNSEVDNNSHFNAQRDIANDAFANESIMVDDPSFKEIDDFGDASNACVMEAKNNDVADMVNLENFGEPQTNSSRCSYCGHEMEVIDLD